MFPIVVNGQEYGEPATFSYFGRNVDPAIVEAVRPKKSDLARSSGAERWPTLKIERPFLRPQY